MFLLNVATASNIELDACKKEKKNKLVLQTAVNKLFQTRTEQTACPSTEHVTDGERISTRR